MPILCAAKLMANRIGVAGRNLAVNNIKNKVCYNLVCSYSQTIFQTKILIMIDPTTSASAYTTRSSKTLCLSETCLTLVKPCLQKMVQLYVIAVCA